MTPPGCGERLGGWVGRRGQQAGVQGRQKGLLGFSRLGVWATPLDWTLQGSMVKSPEVNWPESKSCLHQSLAL